MNANFFEEQRREMIAAIRAIAEHIAAELGKTALDERVLRAMAKVPRHEFVPVKVQRYAYMNQPILIGFDKTISQPLMVAVMTDLEPVKINDTAAAGPQYALPRADTCVYRKLKRGHNGDAVRQGSRGNGYFQRAELGARKARPYLASEAFAIHYNK
jgi:hypothetical protein